MGCQWFWKIAIIIPKECELRRFQEKLYYLGKFTFATIFDVSRLQLDLLIGQPALVFFFQLLHLIERQTMISHWTSEN